MNKVLLFTPMYNCEKQIVRVLGQITRKNSKIRNKCSVADDLT